MTATRLNPRIASKTMSTTTIANGTCATGVNASDGYVVGVDARAHGSYDYIAYPFVYNGVWYAEVHKLDTKAIVSNSTFNITVYYVPA